MLDKDLEERIAKLIREEVEIVPYDPVWVQMFEGEKRLLEELLPDELIIRIEHFGSTAVPGLAAKPIVDMLVEITSLIETKKWIVPILKAREYDYFWRPPFGDKCEPEEYYAWFIKRDDSGKRTHHIHMVESDSELWNRLLFRDYLRQFPDEAKLYADLKRSVSAKFPNNRVKYTEAKSEHIQKITKKAINYYNLETDITDRVL